MSCEHTKGCPLFPLFMSKGILRFWVKIYCEGTFATCERFVRSQRGDEVPANLLPNGELLKVAGGTEVRR